MEERVTQSRLLTTLSKKPLENIVATSIFCFSHNVFNPSNDKNHRFSLFILSSANAFNLGQSRILSFGKELSV